MNYIVKLNKKAYKEYNKLSSTIKLQIKNKILELKNSNCTDKHLKYCSFWSLRVGDYRLIYEIESDHKTILILFIGHRKKVYTDFSKLIWIIYITTIYFY